MKDYTEELIKNAQAMVADGKGILAADESTGTMTKRLDSIQVESTEENRRAYRNILFTTEGAEEFISGVILYEETLHQKTDDGTLFPELLTSKGILPGIKVDMGAKDLPFSEGEAITEGLDGLRERMQEYYTLGARFAKWRAVITIGDDIPTSYAIEANAHALARYAALAQECGLVPIVEPEVLMDGSHTLDTCQAVTEEVLHTVFFELYKQNVLLEGMILKPNMVVPGKDSGEKMDPELVADATLTTFYRAVPAAVPGICFLSGGMSDVEATENLNAMNVSGPHPWELSFSYGRALQAPVLKAWMGKTENADAARKAFHHRAHMNSLARSGEWTADKE